MERCGQGQACRPAGSWARCWELLGRFVELGGTGWEVAGRREVNLGDGEVLGRFVELGSVGRSLEVNEEARRAEFVSITYDVGVGGRERENILHKLDMTGHKIFCESEVKIDEGTMSKGVVKKDTRTSPIKAP